MPRFATFQRLSPALTPDLRRGLYARLGTIDTPDDHPQVPAEFVYVRLDDGSVLHGQQADRVDLFAELGFRDLGQRLQGRHTVAFEIGTPGLVGQVIAVALPNAEPILINDRTLALADLSRADVVAILVEALAVVGRANARRDPDQLAADPHAGIERVFEGIRLVG